MTVDYLLRPEVLSPVLIVGCAVLALVVGYFATPVRVRTVTQRVIPPELARLAAVLGITEDLPTSDSYGRRLHDIIEDRDLRIFDLQEVISDLTEQVEALEREKDSKAGRVVNSAWFGIPADPPAGVNPWTIAYPYAVAGGGGGAGGGGTFTLHMPEELTKGPEPTYAKSTNDVDLGIGSGTGAANIYAELTAWMQRANAGIVHDKGAESPKPKEPPAPYTKEGTTLHFDGWSLDTKNAETDRIADFSWLSDLPKWERSTERPGGTGRCVYVDSSGFTWHKWAYYGIAKGVPQGYYRIPEGVA